MEINKIEDKELLEYLRDYECSNCSNHCGLHKIRCSGGVKARQEKIDSFNFQKVYTKTLS